MERLDEFSKLLAESVSRRESLQRMGAFVAGAVLGSLGVGTAWAAGPDWCKAFCRCSNKAQKNQCLAACRACNGNTSRLCGTCGSFACCPTSSACCNGACTTVNSDSHNCGACGNVCPALTPSCNQGVCTATVCAAGLTSCGGVCVNTNNNSQNCGACGNVCGASTPACIQGTCGVCPAGYTTICGGECVNTEEDSRHCGACGNQCDQGMGCITGACFGPGGE